jgi:hypothetical protein
VALGLGKAVVEQYLIAVDGFVIPLPKDTTILQAFDVLFKIYFVLNISFNSNLRLLFQFVAKYMYKVKSNELFNDVGPTVLKVHTALNKIINKK